MDTRRSITGARAVTHRGQPGTVVAVTLHGRVVHVRLDADGVVVRSRVERLRTLAPATGRWAA